MKIIDLPDDILTIIFLYLDPRSFLNLCSSSKVLHDNYQKDSSFWRSLTSTTFRTPISPLLKADGARWYHLYRRLRTQTKLYTWGQGLKGNLGHGVENRRPPGLRGGPRGAPRGGRIIGRPIQPPRLVYQRVNSQWPTESHVPNEVGVIADLQCGGWSTIILSSQGKLYATGSINSANFVNVGAQTDQFTRLEYPTQDKSAISQFSAGRTHILALTDDHEIFSWDRIDAKGLKIIWGLGDRSAGTPTRVVAGWAESSVYVPKTGIIYWAPVKNDLNDDANTGREVNEWIVPHTSKRVLQNGSVFEVLAHVLLEGVIIWITSDSKVWAYDIRHLNDGQRQSDEGAIQIPGYGNGEDQIQDIQGSFRNFAVFTASGQVQAGNKDYIDRCFERAQAFRADDYEDRDMSDPANWNNLDDLLAQRPQDIPALQRTGVISLQFGDWHYHALHSNGKITSHGHEPESCGALGFGDAFKGGKLRGQTTGAYGLRADTKLLPVANLRGREVWFEPEKRDWLEHLQKQATEIFVEDTHSNHYWDDIFNNRTLQTMFSEWIEQEGRHWDNGPLTQPRDLTQSTQNMEIRDTEDFHLDAYFAIAIGAAGWHSGALVLVDEDKAEQTRQKWIPHAPPVTHNDDGELLKDGHILNLPLPGTFPKESTEGHEEPKPVWIHESFPRIKFPDGSESPVLPGSVEGEHTLASAIRPWRDGMPSMQDLGLPMT